MIDDHDFTLRFFACEDYYLPNEVASCSLVLARRIER